MSEVSTIKPADVKQKEPPKFKYDDSEYQTYTKEGFTPPPMLYRSDKWERRFLSKVDISKGKINVRILNMGRQRAIDYATEKLEKKEYLTFTSDWEAKNYLEEEIQVGGHIEGKYTQQTKRLVRKRNPETGEGLAHYERGSPRIVYTIPFTKKKVDEILNGEHPFGLDSINITNVEDVVFYGYINERGLSSFRCGDYTYEQFVTPEWKHFAELAVRPGGPASRLPLQKKPQFIA